MEQVLQHTEGTFLGTYHDQAEHQVKDALLFHGVPCAVEADEDRRELEEKIRDIIKTDYGVECTEAMDTVCRYVEF